MSEATFQQVIDFLESFEPLVRRADIDELVRLFSEGHYLDAALKIESLASEIEEVEATSLFSSDIIHYGSVAYMSIRHFSDFERMGEQVLSFFEEIQGFEHLIIDIRDHIGGSSEFFTQYVIGSVLAESVRTDGFVFMRMGDYNKDPTESVLMSQIWPFRIANQPIGQPIPLVPVQELVLPYQLPDEVFNDLARMDYGFQISLPVTAIRRSRFDGERAFSGKIWLLVDETLAGHGEIVARLAKSTGFATLVGERTGGNVSGNRVLVALPNTGIVFWMSNMYIIDELGWPLSAGTMPHHFNRQGMDALETALALIDEGAY